MPTQTKENYLKAIYFLQQRNKAATISALAKEMEVNKSTVSEMIRKLSDRGWVEYRKYKPVVLSEEGKLAAAGIIRKHRLTEMFLVEVMGFGWEEVHEIAEEVEHLKSEKFFDKMDELLEFPKVDPHGSPIPAKSGKMVANDFRPLTEFAPGERLELMAVADNTDELLAMLSQKNIELGTCFRIERIEEFDKSMVVSYDQDSGEVLSYEVARRLLVREVG